MSEVLVVGAGAWGTALAVQAARAGRSVTLWARDPARAAAMQAARVNARLPGVVLPPAVQVVSDMPPAALVLLAVPMAHLRTVAARLPAGGGLLACCKGLEAGTLALPLEVLVAVAPGRVAGVLTGPNFAHEVAAGLPAAAVVASMDAGLRRDAVAALAGPVFRLYGNDDPIGAQVGGAAKNVLAIAAGAVIGAGLGENARAALVTRGLAEMARLAVALGGRADTVAGLSGLGDLLLTCTGTSSRNFSLGVALGSEATLTSVLNGRSSVTEGVTTAPALVARAGMAGVEMPVAEAVAGLIEGRLLLRDAVARLLARPAREE